jgi:hypothetical protein
MRRWRRKSVCRICRGCTQQSNRGESESREGRKTVAGNEECGAGADEDLEEEKGDNTRMNNNNEQRPTTHNNQTEYGGGRRKTETVAATVTPTENGGRRRRNVRQ